MYKCYKVIVNVVALLLVIASLFIPPYWHVDYSVWIAIGILYGILGLIKLYEKIERGEGGKWSWGDTSIEIKGKPKEKQDKCE